MYEPIFVPFPVIETRQLILRKVKMSDAAELYELCRRVETSQFSLWRPHNNISETKEMIRYKLAAFKKGELPPFFVVEEKESGKVIGTCSYVSADEAYKVVEIGYSILSDCWGKGYGTEVAWGLTGYAFDRMEAQRTFARVLPQNEASIKVLQKIGFEYEGLHKKAYFFDGKVSDVMIYALTDDQYQQIVEELQVI